MANIEDNELEWSYKNPEVLYILYKEWEMSQREIGELFDVSRITIGRKLRKNNIQIRSNSEAHKIIQNGENHPKWIEGEWKDEGKLRELYINKEMTIREIADEYNVGVTTIYRYLNKYNIERRDNKRRIGMFKGENNSNWKGGCNDYRGEDWYRQKNKALERANHTCEHPRCSEDKESLGKEPDVHHIVPYRKTQDNSLDNLLVLCPSHHKKMENMLVEEMQV